MDFPNAGRLDPSQNGEIFQVSATTGEGVEELKRHLAWRLFDLDPEASEDELWLETSRRRAAATAN